MRWHGTAGLTRAPTALWIGNCITTMLSELPITPLPIRGFSARARILDEKLFTITTYVLPFRAIKKIGKHHIFFVRPHRRQGFKSGYLRKPLFFWFFFAFLWEGRKDFQFSHFQLGSEYCLKNVAIPWTERKFRGMLYCIDTITREAHNQKERLKKSITRARTQ